MKESAKTKNPYTLKQAQAHLVKLLEKVWKAETQKPHVALYNF